jgi:beta-glucosidase
MMRKFPNNFLWGSATSSYQIEGAANEDGKGESIWDRFSNTPGKILNGDHGDVAINHYHRYEEDIRMMKELQLQSYRFSVSWPRIFPDGIGKPNIKGLDFYKRVIDSLHQNDIDPMLTLYHWDLPQALQDKGGWLNRDIVEYYVEYATYLFKELGDVVPSWITHNEPWVASFKGYADGEHAPGYTDIQSYIKASHHLNLSHGKVVDAFREQSITNGNIGITLNLTPGYPVGGLSEEQPAATIWDGFMNRWFLDPVLKGEYPQDIVDIYSKSFDLSFIEAGDLQRINRPIDFLGVNYYSVATIKAGNEGLFNFLGIEGINSGRPKTAMGWDIYPNGLKELLIRIKNDYGDIPLIITENGAAFEDKVEEDGSIIDEERIQYLREHLIACYEAIQYEVNLKGYYLWSMFDNFEWAFGYQRRFGMVYIDYATQKRTTKKSAHWYKEVIQNNGLKE